eukprot:630464-Hanusia_phi.AAC.1
MSIKKYIQKVFSSRSTSPALLTCLQVRGERHACRHAAHSTRQEFLLFPLQHLNLTVFAAVKTSQDLVMVGPFI